VGGEGWTHGEELLLGADEGVDSDLVWGESFGGGFKEGIEDGAADLACCSQYCVGWHVGILMMLKSIVRWQWFLSLSLNGSLCRLDR